MIRTDVLVFFVFILFFIIEWPSNLYVHEKKMLIGEDTLMVFHYGPLGRKGLLPHSLKNGRASDRCVSIDVDLMNIIQSDQLVR